MILEAEIKEIVDRNFQGYSAVPVSSFLSKRGARLVYKGCAIVNNLNITFLIGIPKNFPLDKPIFFIEPYDSLGFIPHVEPDGFVCFIQDENLLLDYKNPEGVLVECFKRTINALEKGAKRENEEDFLNEFDIYWSRNSNETKKYYSFLTAGNVLKKITIGINAGVRIIANDETELYSIRNKFKNRFKIKKPGRVIQGIYIPIKAGLVVRPPKYNEFWSLDYIRELVGKSVVFAELENLLSRYKNSDEYIIFGIPDSVGKIQIAGIRLRRSIKGLKHPLIEIEAAYSLSPFTIERLDSEAIVPRGGGESSLLTKKVLLVGCGSLGGCIALNLAKSGLGELTVCDPQDFKRENIYRHILGLPHLGKAKVEGLKEYIEDQIPSIRVIPQIISIENVNLLLFENFDLVIIATGEATINLYLNDQIRRKKLNVKVIYSWVEPYGVGGHTLYSDSSKRGCYSCLYDENLHNLASFCSQEQPKAFTKSISGCAGLYVPFSFLDSSRTAEIATRLAINCIVTEKIDSQIISWKGDSSTFLSEGFNLSDRYLEFTDSELYENRTQFISESCLVC